jgi:hypothetical protein
MARTTKPLTARQVRTALAEANASPLRYAPEGDKFDQVTARANTARAARAAQANRPQQHPRRPAEPGAAAVLQVATAGACQPAGPAGTSAERCSDREVRERPPGAHGGQCRRPGRGAPKGLQRRQDYCPADGARSLRQRQRECAGPAAEAGAQLRRRGLRLDAAAGRHRRPRR